MREGGTYVMASVEARVFEGPGLLDVVCVGDDSIEDSEAFLISLPLVERWPLKVFGESLKLGSPLEWAGEEIAPCGRVAFASRDFPLFLPYCFRVSWDDRLCIDERRRAQRHTYETGADNAWRGGVALLAVVVNKDICIVVSS